MNPPINDVRSRMGVRLRSRGVFLAVAALTFVLSIKGGVLSLVGLAIALLTLWAIRWDWSFFGTGRVRWLGDLLRAAKYTAVLVLLVDALAQPCVDRLLETRPDLSGFTFLVGNLPNLLFFLAFMWVVAAFGEEFFFRGYLMRGWARTFGDGRRGWLLGAALSTLPFGLAHIYQGPSGVINTALVGAVLAVQFYRGRDRLASCMLTHGLYDTVGLVAIYLGKPFLFSKIFFS